MTELEIFKTCPSCNTVWQTRDAFLTDQALVLNGYQVDFLRLEYGLFLFTHFQEGCRSTMGVRAGDFSDLYKGERYTERRTGKEDCPGYCLDEKQLARCEARCECAYVREIIQIIKKDSR